MFTKGSPLVKSVCTHTSSHYEFSNLVMLSLKYNPEHRKPPKTTVCIAPYEKTPIHNRSKIPTRIQKTWSHNLKTKTNCSNSGNTIPDGRDFVIGRAFSLLLVVTAPPEYPWSVVFILSIHVRTNH